VWDLVNPEEKEAFDKRMFAMAMHLLHKKKQGHPLPSKVPDEMLVSFTIPQLT